jgi:hypothetical protein
MKMLLLLLAVGGEIVVGIAVKIYDYDDQYYNVVVIFNMNFFSIFGIVGEDDG